MNAETTDREDNIRFTGTVLVNLALPFLLLAAYIFILYLVIPYSFFLSLLSIMFIYFIPPAGKESVIPLGIAIGIPWYIVAFSIALMDILSTVFMVLNFDLALKIPILGTKWMRTFMEHGETFFRTHHWLERLSAIGLAIFVMIPMQGTGGISTPIVGRMIGIPPLQVILAVIAGALSGCFLIALGSEYLKNLLIFDFRLGVIVIITIAAVAAGGWYLWKRKKRHLRERRPVHKI